MSNPNKAIATVIADIDQYYDFSFRISPEKCVQIVPVLIGHIEDVSPILTQNQTVALNAILQKVVETLENRDYVRMRDYLHYELRELMLSFLT